MLHTNARMPSHVHVIGAGLAGLSAAIALAEAGRTVTVVEAGPAAGGRCRSYFDRELGLRIDNGNHLLLSGNRATFRYLDTIGARNTLDMPTEPMFPFLEVDSGLRWTLRPNLGRIPWWVLSRSRRAPGTRASDHLALLRLRRLNDRAKVATSLRHDNFYRRLVEPLAIAALNTPPEFAQILLLNAVMRETLFRGGSACIPAVPREGLSESLIDPATAWLRARGCNVITSRRVLALRFTASGVSALETAEAPIPVEAVVLAVPPWVAPDLLPGVQVPTEFQAILNIHFRVDAERGPTGFIGLVGGTAEWLFVKRGHVSVTISAANRMVDNSADSIAAAVWPDVKTALDLRGAMPPWRVVKERRATFAATPEQAALRPGPRTDLANVVLAGDWTATGLPATIEGAIRSGRTAAEALLAA
jgi:squalene-associated FAD-dependent desaturase